MLTDISSTVFLPKISNTLSPATKINNNTGNTDHMFFQLGIRNKNVKTYIIAFVGLIPDGTKAFVNSLIDISATIRTANFVIIPPEIITKKNNGSNTSADIILTFKIPLLTYCSKSSIPILIINYRPI